MQVNTTKETLLRFFSGFTGKWPSCLYDTPCGSCCVYRRFGGFQSVIVVLAAHLEVILPVEGAHSAIGCQVCETVQKARSRTQRRI